MAGPKSNDGGDGSRDLSDICVSQRMPSTAGNHKKLGERHGTDSPPSPPEGTNSVDILVV